MWDYTSFGLTLPNFVLFLNDSNKKYLSDRDVLKDSNRLTE